MTKDAVMEVVNAAGDPNDCLPPALRAINIAEFLNLNIPRREDILGPIMQTQCLAMLFAPRGIGKTFAGLNIAYAIASGGTFLNWQAPLPRRVVYLDGEMPARVMQERMTEIVRKSEKEPQPDYFTIITPDLQTFGMPDISTKNGQAQIEPFIENADLVVVDNLSTLARTGKENEAEGWLSIQEWALGLRSRGKSVLFIHHAGKGGQQRGTSRREDVLDLVINLKRPEDYQSDQGARFEVHFEKARHLVGDAAKPFEAMLTHDGWMTRSIEDADIKRVFELHSEGLSYRKIAQEMGISKSRVERIVKQQ